jgi:hypothetical protein
LNSNRFWVFLLDRNFSIVPLVSGFSEPLHERCHCLRRIGSITQRVVLHDFCRVNGLVWQSYQKRETGNKAKFARLANRGRPRQTRFEHVDRICARWQKPRSGQLRTPGLVRMSGSARSFVRLDVRPREERKMRASGNAGGAPSAAQARPATFWAFTRYGTPCARSARWPDGRPANQGGIKVPVCSLIVRRRFAHHRSIAFSAARIASRLAPPSEPSSGLGGV